MKKQVKPFVLTIGEPAGIGPDLCVLLAAEISKQQIVLCGDINVLRQRAELHGQQIDFRLESASDCLAAEIQSNSQPIPTVYVHHIAVSVPVKPGQLDVNNGRYVLETLRFAVSQTKIGNYAGVITAPIHKGVICDAIADSGDFFSGHTEFFAEQLAVKLPVMLLATEQLKVALVTTHLPLSAVAGEITGERISDVIHVIHHDLSRFFCDDRAPTIGVCGLNPHAGEDGHLGREEREIINPALSALRDQGINVSLALPADTLLVPAHASQYDVIVAMYHDQGLPVVKSHGFGSCVNVTLGLPIIRTSVDHGTALDLAGSDCADPNSLRCAIRLAQSMYRKSNQ